jgi:hypothetical protein
MLFVYPHSSDHATLILVRFQVLKALSMKMTVFWDIAPCSLMEIAQRFSGAYCPSDDGGSKHL